MTDEIQKATVLKHFCNKWAFRVVIPEVNSTGFLKASPVALRNDDDVQARVFTIERGLSEDESLINWFYKRDARKVIVQQLDRAGEVVHEFVIEHATPFEYAAGAWASDEDGVVTEKLSVRYFG